MNHDKIRAALYHIMKFLFAGLILLVIIAYFHVESKKKSPEEIAQIMDKQKEIFKALSEGKTVNTNENLPNDWPPLMNKPYPNLLLIDQNGQTFNLSQHEGKIIILEYIDMLSPVSQAQSGAGLLGVYGNKDIVSVDKYMVPFSAALIKNGVDTNVLSQNDVIQIKVLVYGDDGQTTVSDVENWTNHFQLGEEQNVIVATPQKDMRDDSVSMAVGGYQLLDRKMRLRVDSSGPTPKHNLDMTLIPLFEKLVAK